MLSCRITSVDGIRWFACCLLFIHCLLHPISFQFFSGFFVVPFFKPLQPMQTMQTMQPMQPMQPVEEDYDFENDDDSFYDFIDFGISSNGGRLSIQRR